MIDIIPAIDLIGGQCVRLTKGDYSSSRIYEADPLTSALQFEEAGLTRLHLVDLDGAREGKVVNLKTLERISAATSLKIDFSGGIKRDEDADAAFSAGAAWIGVGSMAVKSPEAFMGWIDKYGPDKILLGADVWEGKLAVKGWQERTEVLLFDFLKGYYTLGIRQVFCTEISADGMLQGPATGLYQSILRAFPELHLIASGGVSSLEDIDALEAAGCSGVIIGKALYEGYISLPGLKKFLSPS